MNAKTKLFPKSVTSDLDGTDKSQIRPSSLEIPLSSGYLAVNHLSLNVLQKAEKLGKQNWLNKDKIWANLDTMKHKMREKGGEQQHVSQQTRGRHLRLGQNYFRLTGGVLLASQNGPPS